MKSAPKTRASRSKDMRTWIVIADGGHARILESDTLHTGVAVRLEMHSDSRLIGGKLAADRLPRAQESANSARHGIEPRLSLKQHEKDLFVARLADYLKGGRSRFDQLVIVAPSRIGKSLVQLLPPPVAAKIALCRNSDMTWMGVAEILTRLGPIGKQLQKSREGQ
ncbi:host attachment protein [Dongia sp.]|uniref:host attachment protein n=1 Tax=Dongia sp. TaxID=1977262 RepID=UPI0035B389DC